MKNFTNDELKTVELFIGYMSPKACAVMLHDILHDTFQSDERLVIVEILWRKIVRLMGTPHALRMVIQDWKRCGK